MSSSMIALLFGGLLKGETLSTGRFFISMGWLGCGCGFEKRENRAAPIRGFSARLTGGGTGLLLSLASRRNSPEGLGGASRSRRNSSEGLGGASISRRNSPEGLGGASRSLRNSPERLGGGGDGGCEGVSRGDLRGSRTGVRGRLGILNCLEGAAGEEGLTKESVFTNAGRSPVGIPTPLFGGE